MRLLMLTLCLTAIAIAGEEERRVPRPVEVSTTAATLEAAIADWTKQTGYRFDLTGVDGKVATLPFMEMPFWRAVEEIARQTKSRVGLRENGSVVVFKPLGTGKSISSIDGPFRMVAREVRAKRDLETGKSGYEVLLDLHWEPRLEVFRAAEPLVKSAKDETGKSLTTPHFQNATPVSGRLVPLRIPLTGVDRGSREIRVEGTVTVALAEEMLTFKIDDLTKPSKQEKNSVGVSFRGVKKDGKNLSCSFDLTYPRGGSVFESFETYWLRANEFALIDPSGKRIPVTQFENVEGTLTYHLRESDSTGKLPDGFSGWKAEVRTPGVIRDATVKFDLRGIELP